jgi:1,4-dihydroxy-2-naphthoate octaprenyltransferase
MIKTLSLTVKPESLVISVLSVTLGTVLAALHGPLHWGYYALTILGMVLLHAGANVVNDYFDYRNRIDTTDVPGSYATEGRVLIQKKLQPRQVLGLGLLLFALSLPIGIYLTVVRGLPVMVLGVLGFLTGLFYTARPVALKYVALGEPAVFLMFGPLMVTGAYYVQRGEFAGQPVWVSIPVGILVALILLANNIRDIQFDGRVRIHTLGTLLGKRQAVRFYESLVAGVYIITVLLVLLKQLSPWAFLTLLSLPLAFALVKRLRTDVPEDADARTAQLNTAFGVLLIIAISLEKLVP